MMEMKNFDGVVVKEGYELMLLMKARSGEYLAIIYRERTDDYVFCTSYDKTDGTWGQGHYCLNYGGALEEFARYLDI